VSPRLGGRWAAVLAGLLVGACAVVTPRSVPTVEPASISAFLLEGRFNLKVQNDAFPGRVRWQHAAQADDLWFYSPLGATVARLRQDPSGALLVTSNGQEYRASDLHQLAFDVLGWDLPLEGLDLATLPRADVEDVKALAQELGAEIWLESAVAGERVVQIPEAVAALGDLLSVILALEPGEGEVQLRALKDHDNPDLSELHVALDPRTLLLVRS